MNIEKIKKEKEFKQRGEKIKKTRKYSWIIKISILTLALAMIFSVLSEITLSVAGIAISIMIIITLLAIGIVFDMIAVAFSACSEDLLNTMAPQIKGSKEALFLLKHADKVISFCADVVGDVCGILCGAAGSAITLKLIINQSGSVVVLIAAAVSSIIACVSVFSKAMFKRIALDNSVDIVLRVGRFFKFLTKNK